MHGVTFARTSACIGCVESPGAQIDEDPEEPVVAPKGCLSTVDIERKYIQLADDLQTLILKITRGKKRPRRRGEGDDIEADPVIDLHAYNTVAKLKDCRIKALRQAYACAAAREHEAIVARREREKRELERGAAH